MTTARPDLDPELRSLLAGFPLSAELSPELLAQLRAGGVPGFDALFPHARVSTVARRTRNNWLARVLAS